MARYLSCNRSNLFCFSIRISYGNDRCCWNKFLFDWRKNSFIRFLNVYWFNFSICSLVHYLFIIPLFFIQLLIPLFYYLAYSFIIYLESYFCIIIIELFDKGTLFSSFNISKNKIYLYLFNKFHFIIILSNIEIILYIKTNLN